MYVVGVSYSKTRCDTKCVISIEKVTEPKGEYSSN